MGSESHGLLWGLPRSAWIGFGVAMLGVLMQIPYAMTLHRIFWHLGPLLIVAGIFGPGILRELGLLRDHDEFQAGVARQAGYHAFLAGGVAILALSHFMPWPLEFSGRQLPKIPLATVMTVMLLTYLCSFLLAYWGARKGAVVILGSMAAIAFLAAALDELPDLWHFLVDLRFTAGFLLAIAISRRYPAVAGLYLFVMVLLIILNFFTVGPPQARQNGWLVTLALPPLAVGLALIRNGESQDRPGESAPR